MNKSNKIFFYYPPIFPVISGESVHGYHIVKELKNKGFDLYTYGQQDSEYYSLIKKNDLLGLYKCLKNCQIIYYRPPIHVITKFEKMLKLFPKVKKILEINAPLDELFSLKKNCYKIYKSKLAASNHIVVVSEILKEYLINSFQIDSQKITVVPNGADPSKYIVYNKDKTILSSISKIKVFWGGNPDIKHQNMDRFLKIIDHFKNDGSILFIVAGIKRVDETFNNCLYLPPILNKEIHKYILDSDILLALYDDYEWSSIGFYGSSLKYFDYLASGKPVIAPNLGQIQEISTNYITSFLYNNTEEIIKYIELLKDEQLRYKIGEEGKKLCNSHYTWDKSIKKLTDILN